MSRVVTIAAAQMGPIARSENRATVDQGGAIQIWFANLSVIDSRFEFNTATNGGALLLSSGPEFADDSSIYRTPLAAVLPAQPTGEVFSQAFKPAYFESAYAEPQLPCLLLQRRGPAFPSPSRSHA